MLYLAQTAAPAANANLFVFYLAEFWPAAKSSWLRVLILTLLIWVLAFINILGARQGTAVNNAFAVAKILPLLMVVVPGRPPQSCVPRRWVTSGRLRPAFGSKRWCFCSSIIMADSSQPWRP
jgi:hypothetical protein